MFKKKSEWSRSYSGWLGGATITALAAFIIGCGGGGGGGVTAGSDAGSVAGSVSGSDSGSVSGSDSGSVSGSDSGSIGGSTAGTLPQNMVFYTENPSDGQYDVRYITPSGTGDTEYASLTGNYAGVALNPVNAGQRFFGYQADSSSAYGIYKNGTVNFAGAVQVVAPTFAGIISMQMSNDGTNLYIVAGKAGDGAPSIFKVAATGGAPVALDNAEDAHLNPAGTMLVYSKLTPAFTTDIWKRGVNVGDVPVRLTTSDGEDDYAQWSKDSTKIVFSSERGGSAGIYTMSADGTNVHQVTARDDSYFNIGPSFNTDGTRISYLHMNIDSGMPSDLVAVDSAGTDQNKSTLKSTTALTFGSTYWTSTNGRAIGQTSLIGQRYRQRHAAK